MLIIIDCVSHFDFIYAENKKLNNYCTRLVPDTKEIENELPIKYDYQFNNYVKDGCSVSEINFEGDLYRFCANSNGEMVISERETLSRISYNVYSSDDNFNNFPLVFNQDKPINESSLFFINKNNFIIFTTNTLYFFNYEIQENYIDVNDCINKIENIDAFWNFSNGGNLIFYYTSNGRFSSIGLQNEIDIELNEDETIIDYIENRKDNLWNIDFDNSFFITSKNNRINMRTNEIGKAFDFDNDIISIKKDSMGNAIVNDQYIFGPIVNEINDNYKGFASLGDLNISEIKELKSGIIIYSDKDDELISNRMEQLSFALEYISDHPDYKYSINNGNIELMDANNNFYFSKQYKDYDIYSQNNILDCDFNYNSNDYTNYIINDNNNSYSLGDYYYVTGDAECYSDIGYKSNLTSVEVKYSLRRNNLNMNVREYSIIMDKCASDSAIDIGSNYIMYLTNDNNLYIDNYQSTNTESLKLIAQNVKSISGNMILLHDGIYYYDYKMDRLVLIRSGAFSRIDEIVFSSNIDKYHYVFISIDYENHCEINIYGSMGNVSKSIKDDIIFTSNKYDKTNDQSIIYLIDEEYNLYNCCINNINNLDIFSSEDIVGVECDKEIIKVNKNGDVLTLDGELYKLSNGELSYVDNNVTNITNHLYSKGEDSVYYISDKSTFIKDYANKDDISVEENISEDSNEVSFNFSIPYGITSVTTPNNKKYTQDFTYNACENGIYVFAVTNKYNDVSYIIKRVDYLYTYKNIKPDVSVTNKNVKLYGNFPIQISYDNTNWSNYMKDFQYTKTFYARMKIEKDDKIFYSRVIEVTLGDSSKLSVKDVTQNTIYKKNILAGEAYINENNEFIDMETNEYVEDTNNNTIGKVSCGYLSDDKTYTYSDENNNVFSSNLQIFSPTENTTEHKNNNFKFVDCIKNIYNYVIGKDNTGAKVSDVHDVFVACSNVNSYDLTPLIEEATRINGTIIETINEEEYYSINSFNNIRIDNFGNAFIKRKFDSKWENAVIVDNLSITQLDKLRVYPNQSETYLVDDQKSFSFDLNIGEQQSLVFNLKDTYKYGNYYLLVHDNNCNEDICTIYSDSVRTDKSSMFSIQTPLLYKGNYTFTIVSIDYEVELGDIIPLHYSYDSVDNSTYFVDCDNKHLVDKYGIIYDFDNISGTIKKTEEKINWTIPKLQYSIDKTCWTNKNVNLELYATDNSKLNRITINDNTISNFSVNGVYQIQARDSHNHVLKTNVIVENIDKLKPFVNYTYEDFVIKLEAHDQSATVEYACSGVEKYQYSYDGANWVECTDELKLLENGIDSSRENISYITNKTIKVRVIDFAGNISDVVNISLPTEEKTTQNPAKTPEIIKEPEMTTQVTTSDGCSVYFCTVIFTIACSVIAFFKRKKEINK